MLPPKFLLACAILSISYIAKANQPISPTDTLPKVFVLGEYDGQPFETLKIQYQYSLMDACHSDMETAYYTWVHMLKHLETYAQKNAYDLGGIKLWLYAFWNKDGSISHLAFYLKPNSRNVKPEELETLLAGFCESYTFPVKAEKDFSNYGNAVFPVQVEKKITTNVKGNGG